MPETADLEVLIRVDGAFDDVSQEVSVEAVCRILETVGLDGLEDIAVRLDAELRDEFIEVLRRFE